MSNKEFSEKLKAGIELAGKRMLEEKISSKSAGTPKDEMITPDEFVKEFLNAHKGEFTFNSNWSLIQQNGSYGARQLTLEELCSFAIGYNENTTRYKLSADAIRLLNNYVDIYLTDIKYYDDSICKCKSK